VPETSPAPGRPRWAPDITVDAPLAARVIAEQFRELAGLPVVQIGAGWDNAVFSVGQDWVFRFIHRQTAVQGSAAEVAVGDGMADVTAESLAALGRTAHGTPAAGSSPVVTGR